MSVVESKLIARNNTQEFIGVITLNKAASLNALNIEMVQLMTQCLHDWRHNSDVVAVFIEGAGDKAFCAGGDVVSMHQAMQAERQVQGLGPRDKLASAPTFMSEFFAQEYTLDYAIHCYPKPIIAWGNGIVMGGGLGLFAAAKFAIATQGSRVAMPEITIGLFPDVGASYFLNQMPPGVGLFLGLTGASFNGVDAYDIGLASHKLSANSKSLLLEQLLALEHINDSSINDVLKSIEAADEDSFDSVQGRLGENLAVFEGMLQNQTLPDILAFLENVLVQKDHDKWWSKAIKTLESGSPITANLVLKQLERAQTLSLAECFRQELNMATVCSMFGEFEEGVRALLIDKDRNPVWLFDNMSSVPMSIVDAHFNYFNQATHPLHSLEQTYGVHNG